MTTSNQHPLDKLEQYLEGSLSKSEMEQIKEHLKTCDTCSQELTFIQKLKDKVSVVDAAQPSELALKRLHQQIDALPEKQNSDMTSNTHSPWWRNAFVAALCVVVIQAAYFGLRRPVNDFGQLRGYPKDSAIIRVRFAPNATERDIRLVLHSVKATIINGPDQQAHYLIVLNANKSNTKAVNKIINQLKEQKTAITEVSLP